MPVGIIIIVFTLSAVIVLCGREIVTIRQGKEERYFCGPCGRAGRPINRGAWWSSYDIDAALIVKSDKTEIVKILDEVAPIESEK